MIDVDNVSPSQSQHSLTVPCHPPLRVYNTPPPLLFFFFFFPLITHFSRLLSLSNTPEMADSGEGLIVSFGEMLIDFVPTVSGVSLAEAPGFLKAPGGAPANVAIAVARLGGRAAFVGKLGDDEFGRMLAAIVRENGVDDTGVTFDAGARTALAFVTLRADGEREFMFYRNPSADMLLTAAELNLDLIGKAAIFHYGSISLITEPCRSAHLKAMEVAKEAGALLSYDPNLRLPLWTSPEEARKQILSIWDEADIIKVSDVELEFLTGHDSVEDDVVAQLWRPSLKLLLVTIGEKGCKYYTKLKTNSLAVPNSKDFHGAVASFTVEQVDTTGAGDAFVGALLRRIAEDPSALQVSDIPSLVCFSTCPPPHTYRTELRVGLQDEKKLREVLRFANACGAITTTKKGAIPSLPNVAEATRLFESA
ncbi:hypothetical protein BHE74_00026136 [Ensete ventricosum]|nr:hypothetical protein BHE74_00026136 [Ensete ventricosum]